jgi:hypothetical protein
MNERIKELAEQSGCVLHGLVWVANDADLEHFAELVRQDEREACAKLCDDLADLNDWADSYADKCAAVIRGRTE